MNTKKEELEFAIKMFEVDVLKDIKLTKKQKHDFVYFKKNLYQILTMTKK